MMFSGFGVNLRDIPSYMEWGTHISFFRYALEMYVESIYGLLRNQLSCLEVFCYYKYPNDFLKSIAMDNINVQFSIQMLLLTVVLTRVAGYFVMSWKVRRGR